MTPVDAAASDLELRFGGVERLYGSGSLERLAAAHVGVIGVGGVGSWAVEALARSGIGALTLIDLDDVCVTNINRQLHALDGAVGRPKVEVLADRVRAINPLCRVRARTEFLTESSADELLGAGSYDFVVDAIDSLDNKCVLLARCRALGMPVVTSGGAGGRRDPLQIKTADLAFTHRDHLLSSVRKQLRRWFDFPRDLQQPFGITAVYSSERMAYPQCDGTISHKPDVLVPTAINCASGIGTAAFVTGTFGFAAASVVVTALARKAKE